MFNRKLPRLRNFDYSSKEIYFVTFNCHENQHLLSKILIDEPESIFEPSGIGLITEKSIQDIEVYYPGVEVLDYVVMPNHVHILISLIDVVNKVNLSTIIGACKSTVTRKIKIESPDIVIWQKSFHDHIIRNERDYLVHGEYIQMNVQRWHNDEYFN